MDKMGLLNNVTDSLVKKIAKAETIRITYQQLAEIVRDEFIKGADDEFLKKVQKTAKGGGWITKKNLDSASGRYTLHVGCWNTGYILGRRKQTYILTIRKINSITLIKTGSGQSFIKL